MNLLCHLCAAHAAGVDLWPEDVMLADADDLDALRVRWCDSGRVASASHSHPLTYTAHTTPMAAWAPYLLEQVFCSSQEELVNVGCKRLHLKRIFTAIDAQRATLAPASAPSPAPAAAAESKAESKEDSDTTPKGLVVAQRQEEAEKQVEERAVGGKRFRAFLSHHKAKAAMEARCVLPTSHLAGSPPCRLPSHAPVRRAGTQRRSWS